MTKYHRTTSLMLAALTFALLLLSTGCTPADSQKKNVTYGPGQVFVMPDDSYMIDKVLFAPEYDMEGYQGYAVVFVKRQPTAPVKFSMGGNGPIQPTSLVDFRLNNGEEIVANSLNIAFVANDGDPEFQGKMTVYFRLAKGQEFPKSGVFTHNAGNSVQSSQIDLSNIQITDTL